MRLLTFILMAALAVPAAAQDTPLPPQNTDLTPKFDSDLLLEMGGGVRTKIVPVTDGDTKSVEIGDLIEVGLGANSKYKGRVSWDVTPKPATKSGRNEAKRSVYFGTGKVTGIKYHIVAWGVKVDKTPDGKADVPGTHQAYVVAECWIVVGGELPPPGPGPGPGPGPSPDPNVDQLMLEKLQRAVDADKKVAGFELAKANVELPAILAKMADNIANKASGYTTPQGIVDGFHAEKKAKNIMGDRMPALRDVIADAMEAALPDWTSTAPVNFDNVGRLTATFRHLSSHLKLCK
jgi:hypothetical protein